MEQIKRLERGLSGPGLAPASEPDQGRKGRENAPLGETGKGGSAPSPERGEARRPEPEGVQASRDGPERAPRPEEEETRALAPELPEGTPERSEVPAVKAQLERLERAAAFGRGEAARQRDGGDGPRAGRRGEASVSLSGPEGGPGFPGVTGAAERGWTPGVGWGRSGVLSDGGLSWAEQADRVFRRDSRRYDGNFYLY